MLIRSKFKDYYDFIAGYDADPRKVYVRRNEIDPKEYMDYKGDGKLSNIDNDKLFFGAVWFCDKLYFYVQDLGTGICYWRYEQLPGYIIEPYVKIQNAKVNANVSVWYKRYYRENYEANSLQKYFGIITKDNARGWGNETKEKQIWENKCKAKLNTWFKEPIIFSRIRKMGDIWSPKEIVFGGRLLDINFSQIKPPQEAFTELYNWIPYNEPAMPSDPSDMSRFENKGFDKKTSFRHPTK